jgi:hypothetical protein
VAKASVRATTVRFPVEIYELVERETELAGISISQYIREATLARLAFSAGRRGEEVFLGNEERTSETGPARLQEIRARRAELRERRNELNEEIEALVREASQSIRHTRRLLDGSRETPPAPQPLRAESDT